MSVKVFVPQSIEHLTNNQSVVEVEGGTVGDCLKYLVRQHPDAEEEIFTKDGKLASLLEIFINSESAFPDELLQPVKDGDEVYISGGAM